jgi:hypothetical protein
MKDDPAHPVQAPNLDADVVNASGFLSEFMVSQIGRLPKSDYDQVPEDRTLTINGISASVTSVKPTGH